MKRIQILLLVAIASMACSGPNGGESATDSPDEETSSSGEYEGIEPVEIGKAMDAEDMEKFLENRKSLKDRPSPLGEENPPPFLQ